MKYFKTKVINMRINPSSQFSYFDSKQWVRKSNGCGEDLKFVLRLVELQVALKDPCINFK